MTNDFEDNILKNIDKHGFFVNSVFDPDGVRPDFSYSIGFSSSLDCPDFIILGLPLKLMHNMLWEVFHQVKAGKLPQDGMEWRNILGGDYICVSKRLHSSNHISDYMGSAMWYHNHLGRPISEFSAYQLVWPGTKNKKLPWEDGCAVEVIEAQPPLWLEKINKTDDSHH